MPPSCQSCGRELREGMNFCPGCGSPTGTGGPLQGGALPAWPGMAGPPGPVSFMPAAPVYPMAAPYPYPYPYQPPPPMTLKRALLVGAGIVTLIAGAFAFIEGIVFLFDGWWGSHWLLYGTLGIVAFAFSIASAVSHFRRRWFVVAIVGPSLLLVAGVVTLLAIGFLAIVVLVLSILALAFTVVGLSEFVRSGSDGSGGWPTAAPVGTGAAPPPEWYPAPPGAGAPPPPAGPLFPGDDEDPGRVS